MNKKMGRHIWIWHDGDEVYIHKPASLRSIIEEVLDTYFDRKKNLWVIQTNTENDTIHLALKINGGQIEYLIQSKPEAVEKLLKTIARREDRPDWFQINSTEC